MIPVHELLSRIRWDPVFARDRWEIAYLDRVAGTLVRMPLDHIRVEEGNRFAFEMVDEEGATRSIPYHRIRIAWRNGKVAWAREAVAPPRKAEKPRPVRKPAAREPRMRR